MYVIHVLKEPIFQKVAGTGNRQLIQRTLYIRGDRNNHHEAS